jgi:hypothetical protein
MRRPLAVLAAFLLALTAVTSPALALTRGQLTATVLGGTVYHAPSFGSAPGLVALGDSITGNGGGLSYSGTTVTNSYSFSNGWSGFLELGAGNTLALPTGWNMGRGAQTSAGIRARDQAAANTCASATDSATLPCYSGTQLTTTASASGGTSTLTFASTTGVVDGQYVFISTASVTPPGVTVASHTTTTVTLSAPLLANVASSVTVAFSNFSNRYDLYTGGATTPGSITDMDGNIESDGLHAACDAGNGVAVVSLMGGTNDGSFQVATSLANMGAVLDDCGPKGANKVVLLSNMLPRGVATALSELHTPSANTVTVTNAASFYQDVKVVKAPVTSTVPCAAGSGDGTVMTNCSPCTPSAGQYNVSAGVYTFNAADTGRVAITYTWLNQPGGVWQTTLHNWAQSTQCGSYTDPTSGTTYSGVSGALCKKLRPHVVSADTWDQCLDGTSGSNNYPLPYSSVDGLHPLPWCGRNAAAAAISALQAKFPSALAASAIVPLPTANNITFTGSSSSLTSALTTTCSGTTQRNFYLTSLSPAASTGIYQVGMALRTTSANITDGSTITCVDSTNNVAQMSAAGTVSGSISGIIGQQSGLATNGLFDHNLTTNSTITGCGTSNVNCPAPSGATQVVPTGWTLTLSAQTQTDIAAGVLGLGYGVETNPLSDGYDDFVVQLQGVSGAAAGTFSLSANAAAAIANGIAAGDKHRAVCEVQIGAGPNGHLSGLQGVTVKAADTTKASTTFTAPGTSSNTYTVFAGQAGNGGTGIELTDKDISSGTLVLQTMSPLVDTTGMTTPLASANTTITGTWDANMPVSAKIRIRRCALAKVAA